MVRGVSAASGDVISITKGASPLRASTALAGKRGDLPTIQRDKSPLQQPLGYHSWGPSGGQGRWAPGFPAIWKPGSVNDGRDLKSAGAPKLSKSTTQIVMFPTPTHAVRPNSKKAESLALTFTTSSKRNHLSQSAPALPGITEQQLQAMQYRDQRAHTADAGSIGESLKKRHEHEVEAHAPVYSHGRPLHRRAISSPAFDNLPDKEESEEESDDSEAELGFGHAATQPLPSALTDMMSMSRPSISRGSDDGKARRRTFHHVYRGAQAASVFIHSLQPGTGDDAGSGQLSPTISTDRCPHDLSELDEKDPEAEVCRDNFREELLRASGSAPEVTFRSIDLNRNGQLSLQEFADGMRRLCVKWRDATKCKTLKEVFKLFVSKDGVVRMEDLFPETKQMRTEPNRMSTPEFWNHWCKSNQKEEPKKRGPKWEAADADDEMRTLFAATQTRQEVTDRKRWMAQTIRRMKSQGKSDARCRELCALHLPRGTGPRDKEYVPTFSQIDVKNVQLSYRAKVSGPLKNIQKQVYAMREQRLELASSRMEMKRINQRNARSQRRFNLWDDMDGDLDEEEEEPLEQSQEH